MGRRPTFPAGYRTAGNDKVVMALTVGGLAEEAMLETLRERRSLLTVNRYLAQLVERYVERTLAGEPVPGLLPYNAVPPGPRTFQVRLDPEVAATLRDWKRERRVSLRAVALTALVEDTGMRVEWPEG